MSLLIPEEARQVIKKWEGLQKVATYKPEITVVPYVCPAGYWTIGYGHTGPEVVKGYSLSENEAIALLEGDLLKTYVQVARLCPVLLCGPTGRLAAILSFTFNLGAGRLEASTLRRRINQQDWNSCITELRKWVHGGGRILPGLVARREDEIMLFNR